MTNESISLTAIESAQKKLIGIIKSNKASIAGLDTHARLLKIRGEGELNNGVSIHNIRRNAESLKIYFDMLEMLLSHIGEDIKDIRTKDRLQTISDEYEQMQAERRIENAERERMRRKEKKEDTDRAVSG